ncbi:hypothetical protein PAHAL_5G104000 [Panicum hallii]|jgi:hypothetical protein|uniref:RING-type E3 ubiquitin transferase n=1 Tax=Panicum hallii TaxID=206008 RepID=A0A2S3HQB3_9POAL|nr:RING-H2 finger protein ATL66-like [Panicum hallii]PAN27749.1 hypothetical protein PAHAL_5G104000 [Panicum hallii]
MAAQEALRWRYGDVDDGNFAVRGRGVLVLVALFGVLVCFVAVCLYLRWACHRYNDRRDSADVLPRWYTASSASSAAQPAAASSVAAGLDDAAIAGLPVTPYLPAAGGAADDAAQCCPICLGELAEGDKVKALPVCGHGFHPECVDAWLRARASCPLCRASLLAAAATTKPPGDDVGVGGEAAV